MYISFFLIVSNEVPEQPVISPVSGHIYERRLIEKYIKENGSDPMNGEKLGIEMLVDVKGLNFFIVYQYNSFEFIDDSNYI